MIDGRNFFDLPVKNNLRNKITFEKVMLKVKLMITHTGCVLDDPYFKEYYKLIAINLSKQQKLYADPKAMQQNHFTRNLERDRETRIVFILEEAKETVLDFSKKAVEKYFDFILF